MSNNRPKDIIGDVAKRWRGSWFAPEEFADDLIKQLRANGYVIKRAVPPCRGYEGDNDASGE